MQLSKNFDLKPAKVLKIAGLVIIAIIIVVVAFRLVGSSIRSLSPKTSVMPAYDSGLAYNKGYNQAVETGYDEVYREVDLSARNVTSPSIAPGAGTTSGDNAEEFEVTEYSANIETRQLDETCDKIVALKSRAEVIFENANQSERSCNYSFKVRRESVEDILAIIKTLNPKELNENTYTIKSLVEDYTDEIEILGKKMGSIEETLAKAISAYDDITALATRVQDVESLAKIIDSKINIIERLTQERINVNTQLERLAKAKAEQLDRLDYTYFRIDVVESKFIDGQKLKDSWKAALKAFVSDINGVIQDITVNLVAWLFLLAQYVIYFFILLLVAKYGWETIKRIWKKK